MTVARASLAALIVAAASMAFAGRARAQGGLLLQGIADVEGWSTDNKSNLLSRNNGSPGDVLRLQMWGAVEPWRGIFIFAQSEVEGGTARAFGERYTETALDQAGLRVARDPRFVLNIGKMFHPVGAFAPRSFSTRNPLIGVPDGYSPVYPIGAVLSGDVGQFDYRAGVVSLPLTHESYQPQPAASTHPVIGLGFTPMTGLRFGASASMGSYLNKTFTAAELNSKDWASYKQRNVATDVEYGVGHFDFYGEYSWASYDVPGLGMSAGTAGYVEGRYTISPRLFVAGRGEVNHYPFIRPISANTWTDRRTDFTDWEGGLGVRATTSTLVKLSYRADKWTVTPANAAFVRPGGGAFAIQLSQSFDVMDWLSALH